VENKATGRPTCRPKVALVILNWNNPEETLACLASIAGLDYHALSAIVVDNGSTDDSVRRIRAAHSTVTLVETGENLGYAGGNNVGIRCALQQGAEYICILNNDVTVAPGFVTPLLSALQSDPVVGAATSLVVATDHPDQVWALGSAVDRSTGTVSRLHAGEDVSRWRSRPPFAVDVASGAAMMVKREVFDTFGLMDEGFFLYYEETDWCLRVQQAGYQIMAVPSSVVFHGVSAALGESSPVIDYYMLRNHLRFIARNWGGLGRWRLQGRVALRELVTIAAYTLNPHGGKRIPNRNARLLALRDAVLGRWGRMRLDVEKVCCSNEG
jgi:GT2 family glycosyltransferase